MTEKSIEQLKQEYNDALVAVRLAEEQRDRVREHLDAALIAKAEREFAARGIVPGTKIVNRKQNGETVEGIYVGHEKTIFSSTALPIIRKIKKDGTAHATSSVRVFWDAAWEVAP